MAIDASYSMLYEGLLRQDIEILQQFGSCFVKLVLFQRIACMSLIKVEDIDVEYNVENHSEKIDPRKLYVPLIRGIDKNDRPFILIKADYSIGGKTVQIALAIFKKYAWTDPIKGTGLSLTCPETLNTVFVRSGDLYVTSVKNLGSDGEMYLTPSRIYARHGMSFEQIRLMVRLLDGETIDLQDGDSIKMSGFKNKRRYSFSYEIS